MDSKSKVMTFRQEEHLKAMVENQTLLKMVGYEFDMMGYVLEKAFIRNDLKAKWEAGALEL